MKGNGRKKALEGGYDDRMALRILVRGRDDFQKMRLSMDNRIGRKADGTGQAIEERAFRAEDILYIKEVADEARAQEDGIEKQLLKMLKRFPIYNEYLAGVTGVGPVSAGWIIGEFDIHKATTVSKMWQFAGLNPGLVRGKKRVEVGKFTPDMGTVVEEIKDRKTGKVKEFIVLTDTMVRGDKLTPGFVAPYNQRLRKALVGVLAPGFIMSKSHYALEYYYPYKARLQQEENPVGGGEKTKPWRDVSDGHRDRAARRYMIKMFLKDLYQIWRGLEGLPVREPYQEEYLGHKRAKG